MSSFEYFLGKTYSSVNDNDIVKYYIHAIEQECKKKFYTCSSQKVIGGYRFTIVSDRVKHDSNAKINLLETKFKHLIFQEHYIQNNLFYYIYFINSSAIVKEENQKIPFWILFLLIFIFLFALVKTSQYIIYQLK